MSRSRLALARLLVPLAALIVVGCLYRGYVAGMLPSTAAALDEITLPPGFHIAVYAVDVPNARQMAVGPTGVVFVGSRAEGKVYAVVDRDGDQRADQVHVLASGLSMPSGVAFRDGALYVAAVNRILRFRDVARDLARPPKPEVVTDAFPSDTHHGWKFIAFGPDGRLYVPVGAPCNVCAITGPLYATITRLDVGDGLRDPEHNGGRACEEFTAPARLLGPHVAAIGMRFYTGAMFPQKYRGGVFIAEHGSWNRSTPIGYRVSFVKVEGGRATSYEPFASGWLKGSVASGRPADVR